MADFEPPSFSLGLDFGLDSEPPATVREDPFHERAQPPSTSAAFPTIEDDDDFESPGLGTDSHVRDPAPALKRLRRGHASEEDPTAEKRVPFGMSSNLEDDIEEYSSQEDWRTASRPSSNKYRLGCSSSKVPLHGHGVLRTESTSQLKSRKGKQSTNPPASASLESGSTKMIFPNLTISPLRRFQLVDSDSDDTSASDDVKREPKKVDSSLKEKQHNFGQFKTVSERRREITSVITYQKEDLGKDFLSEKNFGIPTPALDEVCEEYFTSVNDKKATINLHGDKCTVENKGLYQYPDAIINGEPHGNSGDPVPPAHRYFLHDDPRIQSLVRSRLPNFYPLGAVTSRGTTQPGSSVIDYMSQFSHGEGSKRQAAVKARSQTNSTKKKKNMKKVGAEEESRGSGSWINPKSSAVAPKDAAKRRVQAVSQSAGQWYTDSGGRRIYVNKNGQELTGQIAYRQYRKESGAGFKKSKKKSASKKKPAAKKQTASKRK